jgi:hypothetical protein
MKQHPASAREMTAKRKIAVARDFPYNRSGASYYDFLRWHKRNREADRDGSHRQGRAAQGAIASLDYCQWSTRFGAADASDKGPRYRYQALVEERIDGTALEAGVRSSLNSVEIVRAPQSEQE